MYDTRFHGQCNERAYIRCFSVHQMVFFVFVVCMDEKMTTNVRTHVNKGKKVQNLFFTSTLLSL